MAPCRCCHERAMPGDRAHRQNDKWRFWSTRFFRFSVLALVIFLVMQYGFSALVMKQHMMWARIRNMYSTNRTHNQIRDSHNVTGHMWKSTRYVNSHLQTNTPTLPAASIATTDLLQSTSQLAAASTVTTDLQQNATVQAQYVTLTGTASTQAASVTSTGTASTQAASVTSIDTASTQALSVTSVDRNKTLVPCPPLPPNLVGRKPVRIQNVPLKKLEESHPEVLPGGQWRPLGCISRHRVAIIIPYRDREEHLRIFLNHMHPFLQKQQLDYGIYIVEQAPRSKFNRAMLMNIGFTEASKLYDYQCYIFHDVDLLPEDDRNIYSCPEQPRHMSAAVNTMKYRLPYAAIFGGVAALKKEHFQLVNGFSNQFFGWGGEDDDLYNRIHHHHLQLIRYPLDIAKYTMMRHVKNVPSPQRFKYLYTGAKRFNVDGLNSLKNKYKLLGLSKKKLCTWIKAEI